MYHSSPPFVDKFQQKRKKLVGKKNDVKFEFIIGKAGKPTY